MKSIVRSVALALALVPALAAAQSSTWSIDPAHTHASFTVRHMIISNVRGELGKVEGTLTLDEKDVTKSKVEATIDVAGIDTREPKRDEHLRSADFFDVANHPTITFKSTKVEKAGKDGLKVTGDLTIRGTTKPAVLKVTGPTAEVKDPYGKLRRGVSATTKIERKAFGVAWSAVLEGGGAVVGNDVNVELEVELIKQ
ncbi:MAG: YceI family protein [Anaeromyxobacteraceae bacterium]